MQSTRMPAERPLDVLAQKRGRILATRLQRGNDAR
jgi:hypothetical protein